jgi:hypothetical protein
MASNVRVPNSATTSTAVVESADTSTIDLDSHQYRIDIVDPMPCQTIIKSPLQGNIASRADHSFNLTNMPKDIAKIRELNSCTKVEGLLCCTRKSS